MISINEALPLCDKFEVSLRNLKTHLRSQLLPYADDNFTAELRGSILGIEKIHCCIEEFS